MDIMNDLLYHDKYFAFFHWIVGIMMIGVICGSVHLSGIASIANFNSLVRHEVISLSATICGSELAAVALLISLNSNKKFELIKEIGSENTIYGLFIHSIIALTLSLLLMLFNIELLQSVPCGYAKAKEYLEYLSVLLFGQGMIFFLSSVRTLMHLFK
jgi:hypothetical protein